MIEYKDTIIEGMNEIPHSVWDVNEICTCENGRRECSCQQMIKRDLILKKVLPGLVGPVSHQDGFVCFNTINGRQSITIDDFNSRIDCANRQAIQVDDGYMFWNPRQACSPMMLDNNGLPPWQRVGPQDTPLLIVSYSFALNTEQYAAITEKLKYVLRRTSWIPLVIDSQTEGKVQAFGVNPPSLDTLTIDEVIEMLEGLKRVREATQGGIPVANT